MKLTVLIAQHIREVYEGDNWTDIDLKDVLKDVTWSEAMEQVPGCDNTIAMLVHHLLFYNEVVMERLKDNYPLIDNSNGFDVGDVDNDLEWQELVQETAASFRNLAAAVEAFPEERLWESTKGGNNSFYKMLHGISEHAHYHLGQIVYLKKWLRHDYI